LLSKMKDNFSNQAQTYAKFRPNYSFALIEEILKHTPNRQLAWDCGTGNGQIAKLLAPYFEQIVATDLSSRQIENATRLPNVSYRVEAAENSSLANHSVDLIVVAQAVHWFDFERFYEEVKRVLNPNGLIALIGYALFTTPNKPLNELIQHFYTNIIGSYWDTERQHIDQKYKTIPFPFVEIPMPKFSMNYHWNLEQLLGYLESWSAVEHYKNKNKTNPIDLITNDLNSIFNQDPVAAITFEIISKIGKKL
jgi:ubiquinone/menaquinone biosynthesis C-methylase UbiE